MFEALGAPELIQSLTRTLTRADAVPALVAGACSTLALTRVVPHLIRAFESIRSPRLVDRWRLRWRYRAQTRAEPVWRVHALAAPSNGVSWHESDTWSAPPEPRRKGHREAPQSASEPIIAAPQDESMPSHGPGEGGRHVVVPLLLLGAQQQVDEFLTWARSAVLGKNPATGRWEYTAQHDHWFELYRRWAVARSIVVLPSSVFLNLLGKAAGVEKARGPRARDPQTGKVLKTPAGTDIRPPIYTLTFLVEVAAGPVSRDGKDPAKVLAARHGIVRKAARAASAADDAARPARFLPEADGPMETWADAMHEIYGRRKVA